MTMALGDVKELLGEDGTPVTWWDGTPVRYGETKRLPQQAKCRRCHRPMRNATVRDLTIFGSAFRPVLLHAACALSWDKDDL